MQHFFYKVYLHKAIKNTYILLVFVYLFVCGCRPQKNEALFSSLDASATNIHFENTVTETEQLNVLNYEYLYNGAGVAVGDINNDGLTDIYFTGNMVDDKLYLNKGYLNFKDITLSSNTLGRKGWKTGVVMADINGDGWLDIYVCHSGPGSNAGRANELFINNGCKNNEVPIFIEKAKEYGLDALGTFSTQAAFFDYDLDGDLDMFLLNHSNTFFSPFFNTQKLRSTRHPYYGNKLYRNDEGHFIEVSEQAGIDGSGINYGLGIAVSDMNNDGYPDIYVTNDYEEQDFFYINNRDGTFKESLQKSFSHISKFSMGVDIADYNNDAMPDVVTLDMLPEDNHRQKLLKGPDEYDKYQIAVNSGYQRQQMRNMLQLNRGFNSDSIPVFSEIGQLAGMSNTDWSWSPLFADFDNDSYKDLFITNGYLRDFTNMDFLKYDFATARDYAAANHKDLYAADGSALNKQLLYELVNKMPSTKVHNYIFKNNGDLTFSNKINEWGFQMPTVSTGAAYADLDSDGDLDLVVNNTNEPAGIFKNNSNEVSKQHYLSIKLDGSGKNRFAIGAKVYLTINGKTQYLEQSPVRGYQSSVDNILHFGIGGDTVVNNLKAIFPSGKVVVFNNIKADQLITVSELLSVKLITVPVKKDNKIFTDKTSVSGINFRHSENTHVDFKQQFLIPNEPSRQGPKISKADVNNDGLEDIFIGGAAGQSGVLYLQKPIGDFIAARNQPWLSDAACEDIGSIFFDADSDKDLDLYVVSGGSEFPIGSPELQDRLYINDGKGNYLKAPSDALPKEFASGSCVAAADYDHDGKVDLYVGGRINPGFYPQTSPGGVLKNETDPKSHKIKFTVTTGEVNSLLREPGMVTAAKWIDIDNDGWDDLIIAGEWMPVMIFKNQKGKLVEKTKEAGLEKSNGLWNCISTGDFNNDGLTDFVVGNMGTNTQWTATATQPLTMYSVDLNNDGKVAPVICNYVEGISYPIASRDELMDQFPALNKKFLTYASYADVGINSIFTPLQIDSWKQYQGYTLNTSYFQNLGNGKFKIQSLPIPAQFSVVQSVVTADFNEDRNADMLVVGNYNPFRVRYGPCDASIGLLLLGNGKGNFQPVGTDRLGVVINGDIRDAVLLKSKNLKTIVIAKCDEKVQVIHLN